MSEAEAFSFSDGEFEAWMSDATAIEAERHAAALRRDNVGFELFANLYEQNLLPYLFTDGSTLNDVIVNKEDAVQIELEHTTTENDDIEEQSHREAVDYVRNRALEEAAIYRVMIDGYIEIQDLEKTSLSEALARKGLLLAEILHLRGRGMFDPLLYFVQEGVIPMIQIDLDEENFQVYVDELNNRQAERYDTTVRKNAAILASQLKLQTMTSKYSDDTLDIACLEVAALANDTMNPVVRESQIDELLREQGVCLTPWAGIAFKHAVQRLYPYEN